MVAQPSESSASFEAAAIVPVFRNVHQPGLLDKTGTSHVKCPKLKI